MSNIYLKVALETNWRPQNFNFLSLKKSTPGQFLGTLYYVEIIEF